jgi:hypothetical protein
VVTLYKKWLSGSNNLKHTAMEAGKKKLIQFESGGQPLNVQYNLPQAGSYFGRSYMELSFGDRDREYFNAGCYQAPRHESVDRMQKRVSPSMISVLLEKSRRPEMRVPISRNTGNTANKLPSITEETTEIEALSNMSKVDWWTIGVHNLSRRLQNIDLAQLEAEAGKMGYKTKWYRNHFGALDFYLIDTENKEIAPHLFLIESYRISSFPTNYGAGKTVKTFSLVPGEKTKISISTYKHHKNEEGYGSCILDSNTPESAHDFQNSIESEIFCKESLFTAMEFLSATEIDSILYACNVPCGSTVNMNLARNEFVKNLWKAINKQVTRASSKREILVNTEFLPRIHEERFMTREISNPNPGCTVNYIFRQMNQEFLSVLHLTDIRIGYSNGIINREYTLPELDQFLSDCIFPEMHDEVSSGILNAIMDITDHNDETIREKAIVRPYAVSGDTSGKVMHQFNSHYVSSYTDRSGLELNLNGIILATKHFILPTDSVMVDSLLGEGNIMDTHIRNMQEQELRERRLNNDIKEREVEKSNLAETIVKESTSEKAKIFEEVFSRFDNDKWS